jgi:hypothetical protein
LGGVPWYYNCWVDCLTPNALDAFATKVTNERGWWGNVYAIEVKEIDWGDSKKDPWTPGVHLFGVTLGWWPNTTATIATAVISDTMRPHTPRPEVDAVGDVPRRPRASGFGSA